MFISSNNSMSCLISSAIPASFDLMTYESTMKVCSQKKTEQPNPVSGFMFAPTSGSQTQRRKASVKPKHKHMLINLLPAKSTVEVEIIAVRLQSTPWIQKAFDRIQSFQRHKDGWKGPGSLGAAERTLYEADLVAKQIATEIPDATEPLIGMDDEGAIGLYWNKPDMMANITIYGDGTFSFYAENNYTSKIMDAASVEDVLPESLVSIMCGNVMQAQGEA